MNDEEELHLFSIRQFCISRLPVRSLWMSRMRGLGGSLQETAIDLPRSVPDLFDRYEQAMSACLLAISRAENAHELILAMNRQLALQETYEQHLLDLFPEVEGATDVKIGDRLSIPAMKQELAKCAEEGITPENAPVLFREIGRIRARMAFSARAASIPE
jgi:hypothetical protein